MAGIDTGKHTEAPALSVLTQYIKDLSFESPNAPTALRMREKNPPINININVNATSMGQDNYDVILTLGAKAGEEKDLLFNIELVYGAVFKIQNFPEKHLAPIIFVECPRILFPFARQIIADVTRNGGFPPLMVDPIDFGILFQRRVAEENAKAKVNIDPKVDF
ncbi:MAG: preprotein translocase subunit SecB [Candidatus Tokpelaia sp. JSC189]|nr:MAG: preprotein translocase subunit SecB [Candidatus Tokpelaia sp. JSC189]